MFAYLTNKNYILEKMEHGKIQSANFRSNRHRSYSIPDLGKAEYGRLIQKQNMVLIKYLGT